MNWSRSFFITNSNSILYNNGTKYVILTSMKFAVPAIESLQSHELQSYTLYTLYTNCMRTLSPNPLSLYPLMSTYYTCRHYTTFSKVSRGESTNFLRKCCEKIAINTLNDEIAESWYNWKNQFYKKSQRSSILLFTLATLSAAQFQIL